MSLGLYAAQRFRDLGRKDFQSIQIIFWASTATWCLEWAH